MQSPRLTRTASFPFLKRAAKIYPESPLQTFPKNTDKERQITAVAKIKPTAQSSIDATILRGIKIHDDAASPEPVAVEPPPLINSPRESNDADYDSSEEPGGPPPPLYPHTAAEVTDPPASTIATEVAKKKAAIAAFFKQIKGEDLLVFSSINKGFTSYCRITKPEPHIAKEAYKLCLYFKEGYEKACHDHLKQKWAYLLENCTRHSAENLFFKTELQSALTDIATNTPWATIYINAVFRAVQETPHLATSQKKMIHSEFLEKTWAGTLTAFTHSHDHVDIRELRRPENRPQLVDVLHRSVFNKCDPKDTPIQAEFKDDMFYLFLERLFKVKKSEILHFKDFEFCRNPDQAGS